MYNLGKWVILITEKKKLLVSWSVIQCDGRWVSTPWTNLSAKLYDYLHTWKNYDHNILKFGCHLIIHSGMAAELYGARKCSVCSLQCLDTCSYSAVSIFRIVSWFINFLFHMSCWPKPGWIPHSSSLAVLNKVPWKLQIYIYIYKHTRGSGNIWLKMAIDRPKHVDAVYFNNEIWPDILHFNTVRV